MDKYRKISNREWYSTITIIIVMEIAVFAGIMFFVSFITKKPFHLVFKEFVEFLIILPITLIGFFYWGFYVRESNRSNKALAKMEYDFKRQLKETIINKFGVATFYHINPDLNLMDSHESDILKNLLSEIPSDNKQLRYQLYAALGLRSMTNDDFKKAIRNFSSAIEANSTSIICHAWLAEAYELLGDAKNSIDTYTKVANLSDNIDTTLLDYFNERISIIKKNGPRKASPIRGFRYDSF